MFGFFCVFPKLFRGWGVGGFNPRTRWLANPLAGLAPLDPLKSIYKFPKIKIKKCVKGAAKGAAKGLRPPSLAIWGKFGFFSFAKICPP